MMTDAISGPARPITDQPWTLQLATANRAVLRVGQLGEPDRGQLFDVSCSPPSAGPDHISSRLYVEGIAHSGPGSDHPNNGNARPSDVDERGDAPGLAPHVRAAGLLDTTPKRGIERERLGLPRTGELGERRGRRRESNGSVFPAARDSKQQPHGEDNARHASHEPLRRSRGRADDTRFERIRFAESRHAALCSGHARPERRRP